MVPSGGWPGLCRVPRGAARSAGLPLAFLWDHLVFYFVGREAARVKVPPGSHVAVAGVGGGSEASG